MSGEDGLRLIPEIRLRFRTLPAHPVHKLCDAAEELHREVLRLSAEVERLRLQRSALRQVLHEEFGVWQSEMDRIEDAAAKKPGEEQR